MNYIKNIGLVLVGTVVGGLLAVSFGLNVKAVVVEVPQSVDAQTLGGTYSVVTKNFPSIVVNNGNATTTADFTTTSTGKGTCFNLTATSSANPINMTFAASTTAATTQGIIAVFKFGRCP